MNFSLLPVINAILNTFSTLFLSAGFIFIRKKNIAAHKFCMLSALTCSLLFFISYLTYHYHHGLTTFRETGVKRIIYFSILTTHTMLAVTVPPLAFFTLRRALRGQIELHKKLARFTLPIWLYVSVTGVIIYLILYHFMS